MADKFSEYLLNYASDDLAALDSSISALNGLVLSSDANASSASFFPELEKVANKFNGQVVPGLARPDGFSPLAKIIVDVARANNSALRERALATLVQLLGHANAEAIHTWAGQLAQTILSLLAKADGSPDEVREAALHALRAILDKFLEELPDSLFQQFAQMQAVLLAILPEKLNEPIRQLAADCMGQLVAFHVDPSSLFSVLSDMSDDCDLALKDDPLLDGLLEKALGRMNELEEEEGRGRGTNGNGGPSKSD